MRQLLDEHFSHRVAGQLRKRGCDVVGAIEREELLRLSDEQLLHGAQHWGLILTSPRAYPRTEAGFGNLITALAKLLADRPDRASLRSDVLWL